MKKKFALLFCMQLGCVFAQEALQANYIYEVKRDGAAAAYVFGSMHHSPLGTSARLGQCVKDFFVKVDEVSLEADPLALRAYVPKTPKSISMSAIASLFDEETLQQISAMVVGSYAQTDMNMLLDMNVAYVLQVLFVGGVDVYYKGGGADSPIKVDFGPDSEVLMSARFLNKNMSFVETPQEQEIHLTNVSLDVYAAAVKDAYLKLKKIKSDNKKVYNVLRDEYLNSARAVASGDENGIVRTFNSDGAGISAYYKTIITNRNKNMANKINAMLSEDAKKSHFIALGAAHLPGEEGVIQLLRAAGYQTKRLCQ